jgi:hypothetical protein
MRIHKPKPSFINLYVTDDEAVELINSLSKQLQTRSPNQRTVHKLRDGRQLMVAIDNMRATDGILEPEPKKVVTPQTDWNGMIEGKLWVVTSFNEYRLYRWEGVKPGVGPVSIGVDGLLCTPTDPKDVIGAVVHDAVQGYLNDELAAYNSGRWTRPPHPDLSGAARDIEAEEDALCLAKLEKAAKLAPKRRTGHVTREAVSALGTVYTVRKLVEELRDAKSDHPWTNEESGLLHRICQVLELVE